MISVPADGVKGKTWGPSSLHPRERVQIIHGSPSYPSTPDTTSFREWSRSAPNLEKHPSSHRSNCVALQEIGTHCDQDD